jgi:modulator of FtsH protease
MTTLPYQQLGRTQRDQAHTLFAQTMAYVAGTAGLFALGAWVGHGMTGGLAIVAYYAAADPRAVWEAGGATALFIAAFGAAGYVFLFFLQIFTNEDRN